MTMTTLVMYIMIRLYAYAHSLIWGTGDWSSASACCQEQGTAGQLGGKRQKLIPYLDHKRLVSSKVLVSA
jgi:hypothetical protein